MTEGQAGYVTVDFAYTGRFLDDATGLQNNLFRWYDARTGQWVSEDPIGFAAGDANLTRYVGNTATGYIDPSGLLDGEAEPNEEEPHPPHNVPDDGVTPEEVCSVRHQLNYWASHFTGFNFNNLWQLDSDAADDLVTIGEVGAVGLELYGATTAGAGLPTHVNKARYVRPGVRLLRLPKTTPSLTGTNILGETLPNGQVFLRPGLSRAKQVHVLRHESVHAFFSPRGTGRFATFRQNVGQFCYDKSQLLRFTEEALAEGHATRSIIQGLQHPFKPGYHITVGGLLREGSIAGGGVIVIGAGANELGDQVFGRQ